MNKVKAEKKAVGDTGLWKRKMKGKKEERGRRTMNKKEWGKSREDVGKGKREENEKMTKPRPRFEEKDEIQEGKR